jgi:hypothetical protein
MTTTDERDANAEHNYWIIVGSPENFRRTADRGFGVQGIKSRHRKKAEQMAPGDKLVYYLTGLKAFAGVATVQSHYFESHERIWESSDPKKAAEDYPFRVRISPDLILDEDDLLPAEGVARRMTHVAKYPPDNWTLAFQGNVHAIDEADYRLIRDALEARVPVGAGAGDGHPGR